MIRFVAIFAKYYTFIIITATARIRVTKLEKVTIIIVKMVKKIFIIKIIE